MAETHKHFTRRGHVCQRQHGKHGLKGAQVNKEKGETHQGNGGKEEPEDGTMCKVTQDTQRGNLPNKTGRLTGVQTTTQKSD